MPLIFFIGFLDPLSLKFVLIFFLFPSCCFFYTVRYCPYIAVNQDALFNVILILTVELLPHDAFSSSHLIFKEFPNCFYVFLFKHCFLTCCAYDGLHFGEDHSFGNEFTNTVLGSWDSVL